MYINLQAGLHVPSRTVVLKPVANIGRTKESMSMYSTGEDHKWKITVLFFLRKKALLWTPHSKKHVDLKKSAMNYGN